MRARRSLRRCATILLAVVLLACGAVVLMPAAAVAQGSDDKTYLEDLLERNLSGEGYKVTVEGFRGALSSEATLERLTIADAEGVWLTLEGAELIWSRAALLRGRLEVERLTARRIDIARRPARGGGLSPADAEARPFALPELPVSVSIGTLGVEELHLAPPVLGEDLRLTLDSSLTLEGGAGEIALALRRLDRNDAFTLEAGYANATRILRLDLDFDEGAGGLVARTLGLPGAPALRLRLAGEGPIDDFEARLALASDGVPRVTGAIRLAGAAGATGELGFSTALSGDLRPLVVADLHPFFGETSTLSAEGRRAGDGRLVLDRLELQTGALTLTGAAALDAAGWPERFDLSGRIAGEGPVRLPVAGPATRVAGAEISARFDAARGDAWRADVTVRELTRAGLRVGVARLRGEGRILRGEAPGVDAALVFESEGVAHADPALARALGPALAGRMRLAYRAGGPLEIADLSLAGGDASLAAQGSLGALAEGLPLAGRATLRAEDLGRFAGMARRPLGGRGRAEIAGAGNLLGGAFDIVASLEAQDLRAGETRIDPLLAGRARLDLRARRTTEGTFLDRLTVQSALVSAEARGRVDARTGELSLDAALSDLAPVEPRLTGPAGLRTELAWTAGGRVTVSRLEAEAAGATVSATGRIETADPALPVSGEMRLASTDLSRLAALVGRPLGGAAELGASGTVSLGASRRTGFGTPAFDGEITLSGHDLRSGIALLDQLLAGQVALEGRLALGPESFLVERLVLDAPRLRFSARSTAPGAPIALSARLSDLGLFAAGISGPATIEGTLTPEGAGAPETLRADLRLAGPGGSGAAVAGTIAELGQRLALSIEGSAPLGLVNTLIAPRSVQGMARFALRLDGAPRLAGLSGRLEVGDARVALPNLGLALSGVSGVARLDGGQASVDLSGNAGRGGVFRVSGPVSLNPPYPASLTVALDRLGLSDGVLYETSVGGRLTIEGPLLGGAVLRGTVAVGPTEIRVPSGASSAISDDLPEIRHLHEPPRVRETRRRAGLIDSGRSGVSAVFPLDLLIVARDRIFVRGRGLDAELGGRMRISGTTANVIASGAFSLIRGRLDLLSRRLTLTEGQIELRGALDPYLRFVARTETETATVEVAIEGRASEPSVRFSSVPELPQEEIVAQLLFGHGFDGISPFQAAQLVSAVATLSGRGSGGLAGRLRGGLGLSDLDIRSTDSGATAFTAGAYISDKIYSEVTVDSEGNNEVNLNLDLSRAVTVKGRASSTGETGLGIFFEKDY